MGNSCGRDDSTVKISLPDLEMEPVETTNDEEQNFRENKQNPAPSYAKRVNQRPKLLPAVKQTLESHGYDNKSSFGGTKLPVFYIRTKKGFYHGEWKNGRPNGFGRFYFSNGMYYEGDIQNGEANGNECLLIYKDGSYKKGEMVNGRMEGKGKFYYKQNNLEYDGQWVNDQPQGEGKEKFGDDFYYEGKFQNGKKHDYNGKMVWSNGKVYKGKFENGYMEGQGRLQMTKGGKGQYEGYFHKNLKEGRGTMKTQTGTYSGNFVKGEMEDDHGQFQWYDGKKYSGGFKNGRLHGQGVITFKSGQVIRGTWENGENVFIQSSDNPNLSSEIRNSKLD